MSSDVILSIITAALSIATFQATVRLAVPTECAKAAQTAISLLPILP